MTVFCLAGVRRKTANMIYNSAHNGYKLNSHLTCFQRGFIAQLVEHRTGIVEIMGSNPVGLEALGFFSGLSLQLL